MATSTWPRHRLGDLVRIVHGWPFKSECYSEELTGRPIVVSVGNFRYTGGFRFDETAVKEYRDTYPPEYELSPGDILLVMTCQTSGGEILGLPARVPDDGRTYLHNQRLGKVVVRDEAQVDPAFLYYLFHTKAFNRELVVSASGTKILHTAPSRIEAFTFHLPPLDEQRAIGATLSALDEKISLLGQMNATLEDIARQAFRARAFEGAPMGCLGDVCERVLDKIDDSAIWQNLPLIDLGRMPQGKLALGEWGRGGELSTSVTRFKQLDTLFGAIRPYFHKVGIAPVDGVTNVSVFVLRSKSAFDWPFVALAASSTEAVRYAVRVSKGTKMPVVGWPDLKRFTLPVPSAETRRAFGELVAPLLNKILANVIEARSLGELRERLIPQLVTGLRRLPVESSTATHGRANHSRQ